MKKFNYFFYLFIALTLVISSCSKDENEVMSDENIKVAVEPDFVENDGTMEEEGKEEEAPVVHTKSYCSYYDNYTLLRHNGLKKSDVDAIKCGETMTMPILVGSSKKKVGEIYVANDGENLYITTYASNYKYLKKVYFYIGDKENIPFYSDGFPRLNEFNYKAFPYYYGGQKKATYQIPLSSIDSDCFEVVAYAKVYDTYTGCYYSAFAYDKSRTQTYYYSYYTGCYYFGDWVRSFEYCVNDCGSDCTPAIAYHDGCGFCSIDNGKATYTNEINYNSLMSWGYILIDLQSNVVDCDLSAAQRVGYFRVSIEDAATGLLKVEPYVNSGYEPELYKMCSAEFYLSNDPSEPVNDTNYRSFDYHTSTNAPETFYVTWPDTSKNIYIRGAATVEVDTEH